MKGRPLRFDEAAVDRITIRVTPRQRRALAQVALDNACDLSGVIRDAVNEYVADYTDLRVFRPTKVR